MQATLLETPNLSVEEGAVEDILTVADPFNKNSKIEGILITGGRKIFAPKVILMQVGTIDLPTRLFSLQEHFLEALYILEHKIILQEELVSLLRTHCQKRCNKQGFL